MLVEIVMRIFDDQRMKLKALMTRQPQYHQNWPYLAQIATDEAIHDACSS